MSASSRRSDLWLALLLLVAYGWLFVFFPRINNPNELVRVYMARAIAEQHTYAIGQRVQRRDGRFTDTGALFAEWGWVNDRSLVCADRRLRGPACAGFLYSGKAPGVSLLAAPLVLAEDALFSAALHRAPSKDEYVLVLRWLLAILPSVALWLAVRRFLLARGVEGPLALAATLAGACGSLSYTFGQMVAGHQLTGVALGAAFLTVFWPERGVAGAPGIPASGASASGANMLANATITAPADPASRELLRAALAGLLLSASVCIEYQSAPPAMLLSAAWLFVRALPRRPRGLGSPGFAALVLAFAAGALPFTALFAQFHTAVYGAPWRTGYSFLENAGFQRDIAPGFLGISFPTAERIWGSFFSPALGLFFFAPWTALAVGALPLAWRRWRAGPSFEKITETANFDNPAAAAAARAARALSLALPCALAVVLYYLAFQSMHALWRSGWTVGPRYITPLAPFAALAVALALAQLAPAARALGAGLLGGSGAAAIAATGLASCVCQGFPDEPRGPLAEIVAPLLSHGWVPRNLLQLAGVPGLWSALPTLLALALAAALCLSTAVRLDAPARARRLGLALAVALAVLLGLGQWTTDAHGPPWGSAAFLASQWTPAKPPGARPF